MTHRGVVRVVPFLLCTLVSGLLGMVGCGPSQGELEELEPAQLTTVSMALSGTCADGTTEQVFPGGMVGCAGSATWANRGTLCAPGSHAASATQWRALFGGVAPAHNYWTDDDLRYAGSALSCSADYDTGSACPAGQPMHVCTASGNDAEGNHCNWANCGSGTTSPNAYFGGCVGNTTAGTLCVPNGCADGTIEQAFSHGLVGCAGTGTWDTRASQCAAGYRVATALEWTQYHGAVAPAHNYWTNDDLRYAGSASSCSAETTAAGTACPANQPMHVCTASGSDAEGNHCNWAGCGFRTSAVDDSFGGCVGNSSAGVLCIPTAPVVCQSLLLPVPSVTLTVPENGSQQSYSPSAAAGPYTGDFLMPAGKLQMYSSSYWTNGGASSQAECESSSLTADVWKKSAITGCWNFVGTSTSTGGWTTDSGGFCWIGLFGVGESLPRDTSEVRIRGTAKVGAANVKLGVGAGWSDPQPPPQ
jgi:hypothetical protein